MNNIVLPVAVTYCHKVKANKFSPRSALRLMEAEDYEWDAYDDYKSNQNSIVIKGRETIVYEEQEERRIEAMQEAERKRIVKEEGGMRR